jgi:hypothetical protein
MRADAAEECVLMSIKSGSHEYAEYLINSRKQFHRREYLLMDCCAAAG